MQDSREVRDSQSQWCKPTKEAEWQPCLGARVANCPGPKDRSVYEVTEDPKFTGSDQALKEL